MQNVSEHSVEVGEVIEIVRQMPETAMIQIMKNGRIGVIPKVCVQMTWYVWWYAELYLYKYMAQCCTYFCFYRHILYFNIFIKVVFDWIWLMTHLLYTIYYIVINLYIYIYYEFSLLHIFSLVLQPWMSAYISVPKND